MIVNILLGLVIFGYAGWMMVRHIRKSKQGKCAACALKKSCSSSCSETDPASMTELK
ncbi:FeoB-associated Cys-rich membrane protein [Virgibacillus pantothenticus]|uniref:FeoB-associated Cys-rich membrane protein n=1 Tax=Virgibacillus pantothenticus TaxID=1473 RepID=UPI00098761D3|nr:FeoB-associated Cys-rich membrane protein [Virgibacillus pantothenticus]